MTQIEQLKADIEALSAQDFAQLRQWLAEKDWRRWDEQLAADAKAGKLDFLREEALASKTKGQLSDL